MEYGSISINTSGIFHGSFTHAWFCNISYLENNDLLLFTCFKSLHILFYSLKKKNHTLLLCNITVDLIRQSEYWGSVKFQRQTQVFQNSILCLKAQILSSETKYCQLFFLKWQAHFIHFQENISWIPMSEELSFLYQSFVK